MASYKSVMTVPPLILVIDDNPSNVDILQARLEAHQYNVITATDGEAGLAMAIKKEPDLILLDIMMPKMDGYEVCREIKKQEKTHDIPIIFITAKTDVRDIVKGFDIGAIDYITKPINTRELLARVKTHLSLFRIQKENQHLIDQLNRELSDAAGYIQSLLPDPVTEDKFQIDWRFFPCASLGGDSFGYHWVDDDHFAIYLIDVAGHGVGAALLSISVLNALRSQSLPETDFREPQQVSAALNEAFAWDQQNDMFLTLWYGVYHRRSRFIDFASCGHPPAILISELSGSEVNVQKLMTRNPSIGIMKNAIFRYDHYRADGPFRLYVFSDGVFEITHKNGEIWKLDDFVTYLTNLSHSDGSVLDRVTDHARALSRIDGFEDDFTIIELEFSD